MIRAHVAFAVFLIIASTMNIASAEGEDLTEKDTYNVSSSGSYYFELECKINNCERMKLEIDKGSIIEVVEDPHHTQWAGFLEEGAVISAFVTNSHVNDVRFAKYGGGENSLYNEIEDLPNHFSQSNSQDETVLNPICLLHTCHPFSEPNWLIGGLNGSSDKDVIPLEGDVGDVYYVTFFDAPLGGTLELWVTTNQGNQLIRSFEPFNWLDLTIETLVDYPADGELWLKVNPSTQDIYSTYIIQISRIPDSSESPDGVEYSNPWSEGVARSFGEGWIGLIHSNDEDGDAILFEIGEEFQFSLTGNATGLERTMVFHSTNGEIDSINITNSDEIYSTPKGTIAVEIRMKSIQGTTFWYVGMKAEQRKDASLFGDAPEVIWDGDHSQFWAEVKPNNLYSGFMAENDNVDIFALNITDENGSRIHLYEGIQSQVNYQILSLDQETGAILNSSNGTTIIIPKGIHAIRVERGADSGIEIDYTFAIEYHGPYVPPPPLEYTNLAYLFQNFYILAGMLLLVPFVMVVIWNRKQIIFGQITPIEIQEHEIRRLTRLKERLSIQMIENTIDEQVIESSLHQLGDSPWDAVISEWGEPLQRHMTEQVEICLWKILENEATLLIGIRIAESDWELAAMRVHAPEGATVRIGKVSPSHLFQNDEIFLDELKAGSRTFLRITLEGNPTSLGFQLSGLVDGEPLAAVPNTAIDWFE